MIQWEHPIKPELMRAIHRFHRQEIREKFRAMLHERFPNAGRWYPRPDGWIWRVY